MKTTEARLIIVVVRRAANPNLYENNPDICNANKTNNIVLSVFIFFLIHTDVKKLSEQRGVKIIMQHQSLLNDVNLDFFLCL